MSSVSAGIDAYEAGRRGAVQYVADVLADDYDPAWVVEILRGWAARELARLGGAVADPDPSDR